MLAAALRVLNEDPSATMARIATVAGVGRATLHRHFSTREDLVLALGRWGLARWEDSLRSGAALDVVGTDDADAHRAAIEDLVRRYVVDSAEYSFALTHPEVERHPGLAGAVQRLVELETSVLASAQRVGVLRDDQPAVWLDHVLFGLLRAGLDAERYGDVAPRDIADHVVTSFFAAAGR
ncbi:MAG: helix-turn-helix domain-containing protein [Patulibacter sp.]|nr:TetR/AcrR family transcriptional regulator [Patulibacter sp.]MDO9408255.1 helix-turn-helix domain-containing protein [Patulibacter sp.]